ncbi:helix-turn-helix domain-containing protein [Novosphingobium sp.]|uniref:helix-turn-helix domain-containing protein n=1 Tax=Novosphingobium sp. TaxID=1874826 RepID=UPI002626D7EF|nr:helix-turn-helix domain-containing protein [Novosphingobium sp.]
MLESDDAPIAILADPQNSNVSVAGIKRALMGRKVRELRQKLGMSRQEFAEAYGIPLMSIRQYEIGRYMPPRAIRAYLRVIEAEPEKVRRVIEG